MQLDLGNLDSHGAFNQGGLQPYGCETLADRTTACGHPEKEVLGSDVVVAETQRRFQPLPERPRQDGTELQLPQGVRFGFAPSGGRPNPESLVELLLAHLQTLDDVRRQPVRIEEQSGSQVAGLHGVGFSRRAPSSPAAATEARA